MAKNTNRSLNPNAPPYLKIPAAPPSLNTFTPYYPLISYNPPPSSSSVLTPLPRGPRNPLPPRHRRVPKPAAVGFGARKRWKNTSADYHQMLPLEPKTTSVMIKNIPNKYTRELLIQTLDNHCKLENHNNSSEFISAYDYLYLPIDFKSRANAGFAFVNFTNPKAAFRFKQAFDGKRWAIFDSPKVAQISRAKIQGKTKMINICKRMDFVGGSDDDLPVLFEPARDGSGRVHSQMVKLGKILN